MKKIIVLIVVVIIIILSGSIYYFLGTPTYSLYKTKKAISQHDSITFNKYVDVDRVVNNLFEQATSSLENNEEMKDNPFSGLLTTMLSSVKELIKSEINKSVEEISEGKNNKFISVSIESITKEGKSAKAVLKNLDGDTLKVDMIQTPDRYWRVVSINFEDYKKINPINLKDKSSSNDEKTKISSTVKFGDKTSIGDRLFITVSKPEIFIPPKDSFDQPKKGNRFISVEMEYSNERQTEDEVNPSNLTLKDAENHIYEMENYGGKEPAIEDDTLIPANDKARGFITFEIPENSEIIKAVYVNSTATVIFE